MSENVRRAQSDSGFFFDQEVGLPGFGGEHVTNGEHEGVRGFTEREGWAPFAFDPDVAGSFFVGAEVADPVEERDSEGGVVEGEGEGVLGAVESRAFDAEVASGDVNGDGNADGELVGLGQLECGEERGGVVELGALDEVEGGVGLEVSHGILGI